MLGLVAPIPIATAQTWSPQEIEFVDRIHAAGVMVNDAAAVEMARAVCRRTAEGVSVDEMARALHEGSVNVNGANAITIDQAYGSVRTAQSTVCPGPDTTGQPDCAGIAAALDAVPPGTTDVIAVLRQNPAWKSLDTGIMLTCGLAVAMDDPVNAGSNPQVGTALCEAGESLAPLDSANGLLCGQPIR